MRDVYSHNEVDRFIDGLESGRINNVEKIIDFTNYIRTSDGLTQLEYARLKRLMDEGFIEKFATNQNTHYSTCHLLMNKMRSGISRGVRMLEKLCVKKRSGRRSGSKPKVVDNSKMGKCPYNYSFWGLDYHIKPAVDLYNEIVSYERNLIKCINLCLHIINQVSYIRNHPESAYEKHQNSRQEVLMNNRSVIKRFVDMNVEMENELMKKVESWKEQKKSLEEISAMLYHTLDENEYSDWIISEEVMAARLHGITNQERALWSDDKQQVMLCRIAYSHIDELNPGGQKDHIGGKFLALLYKWSKIQSSRGLEYWLTYFTDFYKTSGGKLTPVKIGAVKRCLAQILKEQIERKEVDDFNRRIDNLVKNNMIKTSDNTDLMKKAANF